MFSRISTYIVSRKWLVCVVLLAVAATLYYSYSLTMKDDVAVDSVEKPIAKVIIKEGDAEVFQNDKWQTLNASHKLYENNKIKTAEAASVVIEFTSTNDLLLIDQSSQIVISAVNSEDTVVEQISGKVYSLVEKKENQTFSIVKDGAKITALGTEFLTDAAENTLSVLVYESKVKFEFENQSREIENQNRLTFNFQTKEQVTAALTDAEKELSKPYLAKLGKAEEVIAQAAVAAGKSAPAKKTTSSSSSTSSSTGSASSSSGSTGSSGSSGSGSGGDSPQIFGNYNGSSVESIVNSLVSVYDDPTGDFVNPGGGYPPSGVYSYPPIDVDNLYMGTNGGRLYIKFSLDGTIPTSRQTENGNVLEQLTWNITIDTDGDTNNGCFGSEKAVASNIAYHSDGKIWYNVYGWPSCSGGTYDGVSPSISGTFHTYNAGLGKKSAVISFALSDLGISAGNSINVKFWSEVESDLWHHYSFDDGTWAPWTVN